MVKQVHAELLIPDHTPQEVFDCAFAGAEPARRYHDECDEDPDCDVGEWLDGERTVVFRTRVYAPASITRLLGMETLTIREMARRVDEGEDLVIHSTPVLDFPGGSKFTTASCLRLSPTPAGCLMAVDVTCEAAGPWGLVGAIEDTMAAQAAVTVEGFLAFTHRWCTAVPASPEDPSANGDGLAHPEAEQSRAGAAAPELTEETGASWDGDAEEKFFDTYPATPRSLDSTSETATTELRAPLAEVASVLLRLQKLEAAVQNLQSLLQKRPAMSQQQTPSIVRAQSTQLPLHRSLSVTSLAAGAAVVVAVAYVALQYGRRSGYAAASRAALTKPQLQT